MTQKIPLDQIMCILLVTIFSGEIINFTFITHAFLQLHAYVQHPIKNVCSVWKKNTVEYHQHLGLADLFILFLKLSTSFSQLVISIITQ